MQEFINNPHNLLIGGSIFHIAFVIFHLLFWKLFDWINDLKKLSYVNRSIIQILNLRLIFVFLIFAYISFFQTDPLLTSELGKAMIIAMSLFWLLRAIEQIVYFGIKNIASNILLLLFMAGGILYGRIFYLVQFQN